MNNARKIRGRPRTSELTRAEQMRTAKRAQRERERQAGMVAVELRLPLALAERLRAAAATARFKADLNDFLDDVVLDVHAWPKLHELAWNRADRWMPAEEAMAIYERNWRFIEPADLGKAEADLIDRLKHRYGGGVLNV